MNNITISLIVSTYNWPEALNLCLLSIKNQSILPDEIIIADDGSTENTKNVIDSYKLLFKIPIIHVWQPDEGFQLSRIRNKAIAKASKDYIIQVDGDVILHREFIADHIQFSKPGTFVTGSRVLMDADLTKTVLERRRVNINLFAKGITNLTNGIRCKALRTLMGTRYKANDIFYMRGCNMAFWRMDLISVNGYNEEFVGWGREDSEIAVRLMNAGIEKKSLKFGGVLFHIYHPEFARKSLPRNDKILLNAVNNRLSFCAKGIDQYLNVQDVA